MNGRLCLCRHLKTTCWWPGYLLAPAISSVSYLRINSALDLSVKLFLCELKVCARELRFCFEFPSLSLMPFCCKLASVLTYIGSSYQLCQQKHLQLSPLSLSWILPYSCQLTGLSVVFSSSGRPLWLHPLHWQTMCCRPAGIKASGSSLTTTSVPTRLNYSYKDYWG